MALSIDERQAFLAQPLIGAFSVAAGPDRAPLTVPIWYAYTPGDDLWLLTGTHSRKAELLAAAGRFTIMVERLEPSIRYVSVEGPVTRTVPGTTDDLREMAERYLPPAAVEGYLAFAAADHGDQIRVHLRPERWLSSDLGSVG